MPPQTSPKELSLQGFNWSRLLNFFLIGDDVSPLSIGEGNKGRGLVKRNVNQHFTRNICPVKTFIYICLTINLDKSKNNEIFSPFYRVPF